VDIVAESQLTQMTWPNLTCTDFAVIFYSILFYSILFYICFHWKKNIG
jgi:hypothetical protein